MVVGSDSFSQAHLNNIANLPRVFLEKELLLNILPNSVYIPCQIMSVTGKSA